MSIRIFVLTAALWLAGMGLSPAASEWEEVKLGRRAFVTLDSFARFYHLKVPAIPNDGFFEVRGEGNAILFRPGSRETYLNGKKAWLSFPLAVDGQGRTLVPKADVILLFDPLIREGRAVPPRPFKGVIIDPGHGGADNGAQTRARYMEKTATLDTALLLEKMLKAEGIPVVLTRRTDVFVTLEDRAALAAQYPGYLFVSIHFNSGPRVTHGVETFALSPQGTPSTSSEGVLRTSDFEVQKGNRTDLYNILLTGLVHREISKLHSPAGDRGVKRARFVVLRENTVPSVLIEGGFMTNTTDAALISSAEYREKLAKAISNGLLAYVRQVDPGHPWVKMRDAASGPPPVPLLKPASPAPKIPLRKPEDSIPAPAPAPVPAPSTPPETPAPAPETTVPVPGPAPETPPETPAPPRVDPVPEPAVPSTPAAPPSPSPSEPPAQVQTSPEPVP